MRKREDGGQVAALVAEGHSDAEIAALLGRTPAAVQKQRQRLGLACAVVRTRWNRERVAHVLHLLREGRELPEIDALSMLASGTTARRLGRLGVSTLGVDPQEIARRLEEADRRERLGVGEVASRRRWGEWSSDEDSTLKVLAVQGGSDLEIGRLLARSGEAVGMRRRQLGILLGDPGDPWTPDEDARLITLKGEGVTAEGIGGILGRTGRAVQVRVGRLGQSTPTWWSTEDDEALMLEWERGTDVKTIAQMLGRTRGAVYEAVKARRERLGLALRSARWSTEDDATLMLEWERGTDVKTIAQMLGRTRGAVYEAVNHRRERLGLALRYRRWSAEDDATLRLERHRGTDTKTIAQMLGRTQGAVSQAVGGAGLVLRVPGG